MSAAIIEQIFDLYRRKGGRAYLGEQVTILEHVLQTATAAERANASPALMAASLLHDIGHFLHAYDEDCAKHGIDSKHESVAADFLASHFRPEVVEPIRLHVAAKRYLCATHPDYDDRLTPASQLSLKLQGGPMDAAECRAFENNPHTGTRSRSGPGTSRVRPRARSRPASNISFPTSSLAWRNRQYPNISL